MKLSFLGHTAAALSFFVHAHAHQETTVSTNTQDQALVTNSAIYFTKSIIEGFVTLWSSLAQNPLDIDTPLEDFYFTLSDDSVNTEIAQQKFFAFACITITCIQEESITTQEQQHKYYELAKSMKILLSKITAN